MLGGIEAGGTKFVCIVGGGPDEVSAVERFPTEDPAVTIERALDFFWRHGPLESLGVASFGPLELRPDSPRYGYITNTPKPGWSGTDMAGAFGRALGIPIGWDTDVNGAALAEWRWGAGRGARSLVYLTIGTGIGGGAVIDGRPLHGLVHPEMGHVSVPRQPDDPFPGSCPFHGDCWEGLASGPALADRFGRKGEELGELTAAAVDLEARYLAAGLRNVIYVLAPERIVIGGGIAELPDLLPALRRRIGAELAGYPDLAEQTEDQFITRPELGDRAGALGALLLAEAALHQR